ncbi:hypothetical protein D9V37_01160 [Nocardioides mangrovicus]|uniref:Acyltransferase 3 domain-containing protein n=1 Tax=Nocardioides mangrovicus TaxID=2478913 RepID=A0A3L8P864_9ACTN|nr:hypothetical protein D9V37_01160 [Nocardioides mangrovicus]
MKTVSDMSLRLLRAPRGSRPSRPPSCDPSDAFRPGTSGAAFRSAPYFRMMPTTTTAPAPPPTTASDAASAEVSRPSARDPWFDNAKFALVALVVVGHSLVLTPGTTAHGWVYTFLYSWHVPAFVLVTGYLSRSFAYTPKRLWTLVCTVAVPYVVFSELLVLFRNTVGHEGLSTSLLDPKWPMWYLTALFAWRLVTPLFKAMPLLVAVGVAVAVSLVGGIVAPHTFDLARAAGLLPFFVVGLKLRREHLALLHRSSVRFAGLFALAVIFVAAPSVRLVSTEYLYYRSTYAEIGDPVVAGLLIRLGVIALGLVGAFAFLSLVPASRTWMTRLGAASLVVYLFHGFVIKAWTYLGVPDWADAHPGVSLLLMPVAAVGLATLLAQPVLAVRLNALVDPVGWLKQRLWPSMPEEPLAQSPIRPVPVQQVPTSGLLR